MHKASNQQVLILTYWNVNLIARKSKRKNPVVLILTYWNVNTEKSEIREEKELGFNLNLLECKFNCS